MDAENPLREALEAVRWIDTYMIRNAGNYDWYRWEYYHKIGLERFIYDHGTVEEFRNYNDQTSYLPDVPPADGVLRDRSLQDKERIPGNGPMDHVRKLWNFASRGFHR